MSKKTNGGGRLTKGGFGLIELLIVIAIIGILGGTLLPSLIRARREAKATECISNLRQIGMAMTMYLHDYGRYPDAERFALPPHPRSIVTLLSPYLECTSVFVSPLSEEVFQEAGLSYVFNTEADPKAARHEWLLKSARLPDSPNPLGRVNTLFSDGSVVGVGEETEPALLAKNTVSREEIREEIALAEDIASGRAAVVGGVIVRAEVHSWIEPLVNINSPPNPSNPPPAIVLGYDVIGVKYHIWSDPPGEVLSYARIEFVNNVGTIVHRVELPRLTPVKGIYEWDGRWNVGPHSNSFVNPRNSPYTRRLVYGWRGRDFVDKFSFRTYAHTFGGIVRCLELWFYDFITPEYGTEVTRRQLENLGYHKVYSKDWLIREEALPLLPRRLIWYAFSHGDQEGRLGQWDGTVGFKWEMIPTFPFPFPLPFPLPVLPVPYPPGELFLAPGCLPPGLNYKLAFLNACYVGRHAGRWSERFRDAVVIGWEGETVTGAAAGFSVRFFEKLNEVDKKGRSVTVKYVFDYAASRIAPQWRERMEPVIFTPPGKEDLRVKLH